jgi:hypothetical protein
MKLLGLELGKKQTAGEGSVDPSVETKPKLNFDIKKQLQGVLTQAVRFQVTIIALVVVGLLALTALRMLHYSDPGSDEARVQDNISKFKQIHLDHKTVQKINSLSSSQTSTSPNIENNRSNPFSE